MTHQVYQVLDISGPGSGELAALAACSKGLWLIKSRSEDGLNVHYHLCLVQPQGCEYEIKLPWESQEICHACQGQGLTYVWRQNRSVYEAVACLECQGQGVHSYDSEISLTVSDGLTGQKVIRKSRAGRLNARLGLRGDLIVNLTWVETIDEPGSSSAPESLPSLN
jgi:hypothetical protein